MTALPLAVLGLSFAPLAANAQLPALSFTLDTPLLNGLPGSDISVTGTLTNNSGGDLFLNSIQFAFDSPGSAFLTANDSAFYAFVPALLTGSGQNSVYNGPLFSIHIADNAPLLSPSDPAFTGSVSIVGGANDTASILLNTQNFQARTVATPAPSALLSLLIGAVPGLIALRRKNALK